MPSHLRKLSISLRPLCYVAFVFMFLFMGEKAASAQSPVAESDEFFSSRIVLPEKTADVKTFLPLPIIKQQAPHGENSTFLFFSLKKRPGTTPSTLPKKISSSVKRQKAVIAIKPTIGRDLSLTHERLPKSTSPAVSVAVNRNPFTLKPSLVHKEDPSISFADRSRSRSTYQLRGEDVLEIVRHDPPRLDVMPFELRLKSGDSIRIESFADERLNRTVIVQSDGFISLPLLGQVQAAGRSIPEVRDDLEQQYASYYKLPAISVSPIKLGVNVHDVTRTTVPSEDVLNDVLTEGSVPPSNEFVEKAKYAIDAEGILHLPEIGEVDVLGKTLETVQEEIRTRSQKLHPTRLVTVFLVKRSPGSIFVLGEVRSPGKYELSRATSILQSLALAGGWTSGGVLKQVMIFRRDEAGNLHGTKVDVTKQLSSVDEFRDREIPLQDGDIVYLPNPAQTCEAGWLPPDVARKCAKCRSHCRWVGD